MDGKNKKIVCVDFDGVLNTYKGWKGVNVLYKPAKDVESFLRELSKNYIIYIFTTRNRDKVINWLEKYDLSIYIDEVTDIKVPAFAYIDDRAIPFNGNYKELLSYLNNFKTHWE